MSWRSWIALLVLGVWGAAISPGWAKPPDLPAKQTVTCQPPAAEKPPSDHLLRTGVDFNALPKDLLVTEEEQESLEPLDLICPCFWEILRSYWQSWSLSLTEIYSGSGSAAGQTTPPAPAPECSLTCPYLRERRTHKKPEPAGTVSASGSVLENLDKLAQAQVLWRRAEACRRRGDDEAALSYYARIQKLCPGSSYERMATQQMSVFQARGLFPTALTETAAEQEMPPAQRPDK